MEVDGDFPRFFTRFSDDLHSEQPRAWGVIWILNFGIEGVWGWRGEDAISRGEC